MLMLGTGEPGRWLSAPVEASIAYAVTSKKPSPWFAKNARLPVRSSAASSVVFACEPNLEPGVVVNVPSVWLIVNPGTPPAVSGATQPNRLPGSTRTHHGPESLLSQRIAGTAVREPSIGDTEH